jgi:predicted metal-dependent hydrolase
VFRRASRSAPLEPSSIRIGFEEFPVFFRRHAQARRLILRLNTDATAVTVTVPHGVSRHRAEDFAQRSSDWIAERVAARGKNIPLRPGSRIPLRGVEHDIVHVPTTRGFVTVNPDSSSILVAGDLPHVARRLTDWLKRTARDEISSAARRYAESMGVSFRRICLRDQRSRWGSCSASGDLSFSWRLILAPSYVLDYVAAHEVAHLKYMDHSSGFWRLVLTHCPDATRAKRWLKLNGQDVHRVVL